MTLGDALFWEFHFCTGCAAYYYFVQCAWLLWMVHETASSSCPWHCCTVLYDFTVRCYCWALYIHNILLLRCLQHRTQTQDRWKLNTQASGEPGHRYFDWIDGGIYASFTWHQQSNNDRLPTECRLVVLPRPAVHLSTQCYVCFVLLTTFGKL